MAPFRSEGSLRLSRRKFLGVLSVPVVAAACRQRLYDPAAFHLPAFSPVGLFPAADYSADFKDIIVRGLHELGVDVRGRRVLLKPNMVEYESHSAINTHPLVVTGAALAFRELGAANVVVAEGPGHRRDIEYLLTQTGLHDHLRENRIRFIDLNHDDVRYVPLRSHFTKLKELAFPAELLDSDFIVSMPKLKTHHWAGMTAAMKNFFGVVPGAVYGWPKNLLHQVGIANSIIDLNATIRPHFAIVDAVVGMEGDGPIMGIPRQVGCIGMGADVVAVDATCARLIGLDPLKVPYLKAAGQFLGNVQTERIHHRGEVISRYAAPFDVLDSFKSMRLSRR